MKLDGFTVCTDGDNIHGLQFFLTETPYLEDDYAELLLLAPIGQMTGKCATHRFSGPVDQIKAASKSGKGISGLSIHYDDKMVKMGRFWGLRYDKVTWDFTEE